MVRFNPKIVFAYRKYDYLNNIYKVRTLLIVKLDEFGEYRQLNNVSYFQLGNLDKIQIKNGMKYKNAEHKIHQNQ